MRGLDEVAAKALQALTSEASINLTVPFESGRVSGGTWKRPGNGGKLVSKETTYFQPVLREERHGRIQVPKVRTGGLQVCAL